MSWLDDLLSSATPIIDKGLDVYQNVKLSKDALKEKQMGMGGEYTHGAFDAGQGSGVNVTYLLIAGVFLFVLMRGGDK